MAESATVAVEQPATSQTDVSVVVPAYNEAETIPDLVVGVTDVLDGRRDLTHYEVVIVNDGSTDDTERILEHTASLFEQVKAVHLARNFGQSAALAAGIDHARGDVIVTMDADLQNDPGDIPVLLDRLDEGYDCVSGHRVDRQDPLSKRVPSQIQTVLAKLTGPDINDFGCTLKAYRADALGDIDLYGEGHRYIPAKLYQHGYDVTEVPVEHHERQNGSSHYGALRLIRGFVDLLFHVFWNRYSTRPGHVFTGLGVLLIAMGGVIGGHAVLMRLLFGSPLLEHLPRLIVVAGMVLFGGQLVVFGLLAEILTKLYYREERPYRVKSD